MEINFFIRKVRANNKKKQKMFLCVRNRWFLLFSVIKDVREYMEGFPRYLIKSAKYRGLRCNQGINLNIPSLGVVGVILLQTDQVTAGSYAKRLKNEMSG
jgi:hypothetical protein